MFDELAVEECVLHHVEDRGAVDLATVSSFVREAERVAEYFQIHGGEGPYDRTVAG